MDLINNTGDKGGGRAKDAGAGIEETRPALREVRVVCVDVGAEGIQPGVDAHHGTWRKSRRATSSVSGEETLRESRGASPPRSGRGTSRESRGATPPKSGEKASGESRGVIPQTATGETSGGSRSATPSKSKGKSSGDSRGATPPTSPKGKSREASELLSTSRDREMRELRRAIPSSPARMDLSRDTSRGRCRSRSPSLSSVGGEETDAGSVALVSGTRRPGPQSAKRGRGRPVTTGAWAIKKAELARLAAERELRRDAEIGDVTVPPRDTRRRRDLVAEEELVRELRCSSATELAVLAREHTGRIEKIASCANNLKGTDVRRLRESARTLGAGMGVLVGRAEAADQDSAAAAELEVLRSEIRSLRYENRQLRADVRAARQRADEERGVAGRATLGVLRAAPLDGILVPRVESDGMGTGGWTGDDNVAGRPLPLPSLATGETEERRVMPPPPPPVDCPLPARAVGRRKGRGQRGDDRGSSPPPQAGTAVPVSPTSAPESVDSLLLRVFRDVDRLSREIRDLREGGLPGSTAGGKTPQVAGPTAAGAATAGQAEESAGGGKTRRKVKAASAKTDRTTAGHTPKTPKGGPAGPARGRPASLGARGKGGKEIPPRPIPSPQEAADGRGGGKRAEGGGVKPPPKSTGNAPPAPPRPGQETWVEVVKRGKKKGQGTPPSRGGPPAPLGGSPKGGAKGQKPSAPPVPRRLPRAPRTAAVVLACPPGEYAEVMKEARARIALRDVGIDALQVTRALTGALHFGIAGEGKEARADALASRLREVFSGRDGVTVARPERTAELRLRGLEDSVTAEEIASAVAECGACRPESVRVGATHVAPGGLGSVWVRCPVRAARKAVSAGRLTVGWSSCRVELLPDRPLQCYKCLEGGHVRAKCPSVADRSDRCYRCGGTDHKAKSCTGDVKCPLCADLGLPAGHRAGSKACRPARRKGDRGGGAARTGADGARSSGRPTVGPQVSAAGAGRTGSAKTPVPPPTEAPASSPQKGKRAERKRARRRMPSSSSEDEGVRRAGTKGARLDAASEEPLEKRPLRRASADEPQPSESMQESTPMEVTGEELVPDLK